MIELLKRNLPKDLSDRKYLMNSLQSPLPVMDNYLKELESSLRLHIGTFYSLEEVLKSLPQIHFKKLCNSWAETDLRMNIELSSKIHAYLKRYGDTMDDKESRTFDLMIATIILHELGQLI
jgi:hypothetical protein